MSTRRRITVIVVLAAAFALSLVIGVAGWLGFTQAGLDRVVAVLESLDAVEIRIEGARGRLAGPLELDALRLATQRLRVEADGLSLDHLPAALLAGRLAVSRLDVARLRVEVGPATEPPSGQPPSFLPRWLSLSFDDTRVAVVELSLPQGTLLAARDVELGGRLTHSRIELDRLRLAADEGTAEGSLQLVAREPLRIAADLDWTLALQPAASGRLHARGDLDRLELTGHLAAPAVAEAAVTLFDVGSELRFEASVSSDSVDLSPWMAEAPLGPLAGSIDANGSLRAIEARGRLSGKGLPVAGVDLVVGLRLPGERIELAALEVASADGRMRVTGAGSLTLGAEPTFDLGLDWEGLSWPLDGRPSAGSPRGRLTLKGWRAIDFALEGAAVVTGYPGMQVVATGVADPEGIAVRDARLSGRPGTARLSGYFGFDELRPWQVEAAVHNLDLGMLRSGLDSRLAFDLSASGWGLDADAAWAAVIGQLSGTFHQHPVTGRGFVRHHPGLTEFERFDFNLGPARAVISGHVGEGTSLDARIDAEDLSLLDEQLGGSIGGSLRLRDGADARRLKLDAAFRGRDLSYGEQRVAVLSLDTVIDLSDRDSSWARLRAAGMHVGGQEIASTRLSLDGRATGHEFELQVGAGERALRLLGEGQYTEGTYAVTATRLSGEGPQLQGWSLQAPMQARITRDSARLEETCFVRDPRRWCIEGAWNAGGHWSASLDTRAFPIEALDVALPGRPEYFGLLDLDATAEGHPGVPWTASADLTLREARFAYLTPSGRREERSLGETRLQVRSYPERHEARIQSRDTEVFLLDGSATIDRLAGRSLADSAIDGRLSLETSELGLLPLVIADLDRAAGSLDADIALSGTVGAVEVRGTIDLTDGALELYQTNLRLADVAARLRFEDNSLSLKSTGRAGEGSFDATGELAWRDGGMHGSLELDGTRLLVADLPEARVEASPDLDFRIDGRDVRVTGTVTVPRARIEPKQTIGAVTASSDERIVGPEAANDVVDEYRVTSDVRLVLGDAVRIDAFGLSGRLEGSVRAQSRPGEVAVASGELEVVDGEYRAFSKELTVDRGRLIFAGGPVADPGVDLRAMKELPGYEVGVIVRGRLRKPEISLYSVPPLPQSQIASLLIVGRSIDTLQSGDREAIGSSTPGLIAEGGALLAGQLGRYVGIDEISIETDADYEASLVLGKFLSPRLYLGYGISLTNAINTFKLRYTIGDNWVIAGEVGQESSIDIEYTVDR